MLNLVKNLMSNDIWRPSRRNPFIDRSYLARMQVGSLVGFGSYAPLIVSDKRLEITSVNTYHFSDYQYIVYGLSHDGTPAVNLIVADMEGEQYLALSRKVQPDERGKLFQGQAIEDFTKKPARAELRCKHNLKGFRGWLSQVYHKALEGMPGAVYPGNFSDKPLPQNSAGEEFEYFLYVSDGDEYAIEIEKYQDGHVEIYATVYRPVSDIVSISIPRKPRLVVQKKSPLPEFSAELDKAMSQPTKAQLQTIEEIVPVTEKIVTVSPMQPSILSHVPENMMACNVKAARRILEEAVKNGITLSQLVRKVVGLPVELKEEIFFSLPLSDQDYVALAKRYKVSADDREIIHARIMEEVTSFAGVRD